MRQRGLLSILMLMAAQLFAADRIDFLDNGTLKIGVNLDLGGSITYLSKSGTTENLINSWDWGRQIQQSYYSGPIPFGNPAPEWKTLGWNPIQSGDHFRNRSKIVEHRNDGKELYVKTIPMIWPVENVVGECTFETWITLDGNAAKVRCRLNNARADKAQYPARHQELPAVYTNGVYWKLMTYMGDKPYSGDEMARIAKKEGGGFPWKSWHATECWAALVNDADWGLGIHTPNTFNYMGGFAGKENTGGEKDDPCGYIAPISRELIDHNIVYDYSYTLILGSLKEIREHAYMNKAESKSNWVFKSDRQRWSYINATDTGWPIKDHLHIHLEWADPQLFSPEVGWDAKAMTKLKIRAATNAKNPKAQLFWKTLKDPNFSGERCIHFELKPDGKFHDYEINFAANGNYSGLITQFRLDPVPSGGEGEYIKIERIGSAD